MISVLRSKTEAVARVDLVAPKVNHDVFRFHTLLQFLPVASHLCKYRFQHSNLVPGSPAPTRLSFICYCLWK